MHPSHPTDHAVRFERQREAFAHDPAPMLALTHIARPTDFPEMTP